MALNQDAVFKISADVTGQQAVDKLADSLRKMGAQGEMSAKQTVAAMRMVPAQLTDIATQLAGGQSPFLIMMQQGGQLRDMFGSVTGALVAVGRTIGGLLTPVNMVVAAIGAIAFTAYKSNSELEELNRQLALSGNVADMSRTKIDAMAAAMARATGNSIGNNKELISGALSAGFGAGSIETVTRAMAEFQKISGKSAEESQKAFASMASSASAWAATANKAYAFLSPEQYKYIKQLELQGKNDEAARLSAQLLYDELKRREPQLSGWTKMWEEAGNAISAAWNAVKQFAIPDDSLQGQIDRTKKSIAELQALVNGNRKGWFGDTINVEPQREQLREYEENLTRLEKLREEEIQRAKEAAARQKAVDEEVRFGNALRTADVSKYLTSEKDRIAELDALNKRELQQTEFLHANKLMSDKVYYSELKRLQDEGAKNELAAVDAEIEAEKRRQSDMDKGQRAQSVAKLAELEARKTDIRRQGLTSQLQLDKQEMGSDLSKAKALQQYTEDLKHQNDMVRLEAQAVDMSTFAYKQLVETKQAEFALRQKTRDMLDDEAAKYEAAAKKALEEKQALQQLNYEKSRLFETGVKEAMRDYVETTSNAAQQAKDLFTNAFKGMEDALVNFVKTGKLDFASLADSIISDLIRIQVQQSITKPLAEAMGSSGMMAAVKGFFGFANGGIMTAGGSLPLNTYASGGVANSPQMAIFGEGRTPEAYVPLPDGRHIPVAMQGGGGSNVVVNVVNNANGTQATTQERQDSSGNRIIDVMIEQVKASIAADISRGVGTVTSALERTYGANRAAGAY